MLKVHDHMVGLAFASTQHKLQARTVDRLVLCLRPRKFRPNFSLTGLHVLASRVRKGMWIRTIGFDPRRDGITHLTSLQHPPVLSIWDASYDDAGYWNDELHAAALHAAVGADAPLDVEPDAEGMDVEPN